MESEPQDKPKHEKLAEVEKGAIEEVEATQNKFTRNLTSPFINKALDWSDSEKIGNIPEWLRVNI